MALRIHQPPFGLLKEGVCSVNGVDTLTIFNTQRSRISLSRHEASQVNNEQKKVKKSSAMKSK